MDWSRWISVLPSFLFIVFMHIRHNHAQGQRPDDCVGPADIVIVVDGSDSITFFDEENWQKLLDFVNQLAQTFPLDKGTHVGLVQFATTARVEFGLNKYFTAREITEYVNQMSRIEGETNIALAINTMVNDVFGRAGDRPDIKDLAIVITDGTHNAEGWNVAFEAKVARDRGIEMFAVGVRSRPAPDSFDVDELREIASPPAFSADPRQNHVFTAQNFNQLAAVIRQLTGPLCTSAGFKTSTTGPPTLPPTTPPPIQPCPGPADIVFVVDASNSIVFLDPLGWERVLEFVRTVVEPFPVNPFPGSTHFGMVKFGSYAQVEFTLDEYTNKQQLLNKLNARNIRRLDDETNIAAGLRLMRSSVFTRRGDRGNVKDIAVVVTDGFQNVPGGRTDVESRLAREAGIDIFVVGVTSNINRTELNIIASDPKRDHVYFVQDFQRLQRTVRDMLVPLCDSSGTQPTPRPTTPTPTIPPVTDCTDALVDVVFMLDDSGSVGQSNFEIVKEFVASVIRQIDLDSGSVRLGVGIFGDDAQIIFELNEYDTRADAIDAVRQIIYRMGKTNTAEALRLARTAMFNPASGDRPNAQNLAIIITDGVSDDREATFLEARQARRQGIHVISVGVGDPQWLDLQELRHMASYPADVNVLQVNDFNALNVLTDRIRDAICNNRDECASNPCVNGRCEEGIGYYSCICEFGWAGVNCDRVCRGTSDVVFAVDASGSVGKENFQKLMDAVLQTVLLLDISSTSGGNSGARIGLITFADNAKLEFHMNEFLTKYDILDNVKANYTGGKTNTASAIQFVRTNMFRPQRGDRPTVPNYLVVLTDGKSNNPDETWEEAMTARDQGIITTIGIGGGINLSELQGIASAPTGQTVMTVDTFDDVINLASRLAEGLCNNVNECGSNPCRNGALCRDGMYGYECEPCRQGFSGYNCERRCNGYLDLAFVLDASGSIHHERFPIIKEFVADIVQNVQISDTETRVALVSWSDGAQVSFTLNEYKKRQDVVQAIRTTQFQGGKTNTAEALRLLRTQVFQPRNGDRIDAPNYVVIITDGNSNINPQETVPEANKDKNEGMYFIVIAIGGRQDTNYNELSGIASRPVEENIYQIERISMLQSLQLDAIQSFCDNINECTVRGFNPCGTGQCIDLLNRYICLCPPGRTGRDCNRQCGTIMDLALLLDLSGSVDEVHQITIELARAIAYGVDMNLDRARVAGMAYSTGIIDTFNLNQYTEKEQIINALTFYDRGGKTNIPLALSELMSEIFVLGNGDRGGVPNIAVLLTDGYATIDEGRVEGLVQQVKDRGTELYIIGVGANVNPRVRSWTTPTSSEHYFRLENRGQIPFVADAILTQLCR